MRVGASHDRGRLGGLAGAAKGTQGSKTHLDLILRATRLRARWWHLFLGRSLAAASEEMATICS